MKRTRYNSEWLTTSEAADELAMSSHTLRKLIREGQIAARMVGTHYRIAAAEVSRYEATNSGISIPVPPLPPSTNHPAPRQGVSGNGIAEERAGYDVGGVSVTLSAEEWGAVLFVGLLGVRHTPLNTEVATAALGKISEVIGRLL